MAVVLASGWYFWVRPSGSLAVAWDSLANPTKFSSGGLNASGTLETTVLSIGSEMPGRVLEVGFQEGDLVKAGSVLVRLDDGMLKTKRAVASANLETAQLALQQLSSPAVIAGLEKTIAQDKQAILDAHQAQDTHQYFVNDTAAVQSAQSKLYMAGQVLDRAKTAYEKIKGDPSTDTTKAAAFQQYYLAEQAYENALTVYNIWTGIHNPDQDDLRAANLAFAEAKLAEDQTLLDGLDGAAIPDTATGAGLLKLQKAKINIQIAQATLALLDEQIGKMTVTAPVDGVVMTRSVDPGNVVNPGSKLLSLARLDSLNIKVNIPAESYRKISLGQIAYVVVDSYPAERFQAVVVRIADQPNFMPRTTHAASGASSTVYSIDLDLQDASGRLKSGMPADVYFGKK